ncbi:MAG TPA: methylated-DNA--[protein]-cysteine S-methyltransferase [Anaerolineales bacterium]|jgi:methylated-DNA-[protein]-cysteine S-methyltransferase
MKDPQESRFASWLGDAPPDTETPDPLLQSLDALFAAGPDPAAHAHARQSLDQALTSAAQPTYGMLNHGLLGAIFVALGPEGVLAVEFGLPEAEFLERVLAMTGGRPRFDPQGLAAVLEQLEQLLSGRRSHFDLPVDLQALTDFQRRVLAATARIPRGQVMTYSQIAHQIGKPRAARAVGQALAHNPVPLLIPCHRVVASDGRLTGYSGGGGIATKARLLQLEGASLA